MMLAGPTLRVVPVTDARRRSARCRARCRSTDRRARRAPPRAGCSASSASPQPRIAFAGLNPHAGEGGALGREEIEIIAPAIAQLLAEEDRRHRAARRPTPCSTRAPARDYDAALCMYHDQALIPLKTLHFDEGVNMTLGLPIVRTSPDHGTAFDIAGKDLADPGAMIAAIRIAGECARAHGSGRLSVAALPPLREVIARHGLGASKALGQNFLLDEQLLDRIARVPGPLAGRRGAMRSGPAPAG